MSLNPAFFFLDSVTPRDLVRKYESKGKKQHQELSQKAHVPPQQFHSSGNDIIKGVGDTVETGGGSQEELSLFIMWWNQALLGQLTADISDAHWQHMKQ